MIVAIALVHYKAVTPTYLIVDMSSEVWRKFLFASQQERQKIIIQKLKPHLVGTVRELVWIPLNGQNKLQIINENDVINL